MIYLNGNIITPTHFPDNTQMLHVFSYQGEDANVYWYYENDEELVTLYFIVNHIRNVKKDVNIELFMAYTPNARMDRVKKEHEVFTLKHFAKFINDMKFNKVYILDPHSNVTPALIDNVVVIPWQPIVNEVLNKLEVEGVKKEDLVIFFPDDGAMKRYDDRNVFGDKVSFIYGKKVRDWSTGKILSLEVYDSSGHDVGDFLAHSNIEGTTVLMIDDIISYGGTLAYSADKLKEFGVKDIYAYATHCENSVLDEEKGELLKRLKNGTVKKIFTTDSLFNKESEYVTVINYLQFI